MFENVKLEKGMYNLSGKSFSEYLEENDPAENYTGTPYEGLDAFERQLKRFDIRIGGECCDRVEKFFTTTESAVLFPEFVRRSIKKGFEDCCLDDMVAAKTLCESNHYSGCVMTETSYDKATEGETMAASVIKENSTVITLKKYGRLVNSSYEAVRQQRLDLFAVMLRGVGKKLADTLVADAVSILKTNTTQISSKTTVLDYSDITALYGAMGDFNMNTIIVSPANAAKILAMQQLMESSSREQGKIYLPFGAKMITSSKIDDYSILGFDRDFTLEFVASTDVVLETDKLIDRQLDQIGISICAGFKKIFNEAVKMLSIKRS